MDTLGKIPLISIDNPVSCLILVALHHSILFFFHVQAEELSE